MSYVLIDTNVLLRSASPNHPQHQQALIAQTVLYSRGEQPCLVTQTLIEFRVVATRPVEVNGLGMSHTVADTEIARLKALYSLFLDVPSIFAEWEHLVSYYGVAGKQNHDARLVAAMNIHGISSILTFNKSDFMRYSGITVWEPKDLLSLPSL